MVSLSEDPVTQRHRDNIEILNYINVICLSYGGNIPLGNILVVYRMIYITKILCIYMHLAMKEEAIPLGEVL